MIDKFFGEFRFLSNFWPSPVSMDGQNYPTVEHAYQAAKTTDLEIRKQCLDLTAGQTKRWGRTLQIRSDWEDVKISVMSALVNQKFKSNANLAKLLLATYPHNLIEGNSWGDTFWGVCNGKGSNHLGVILEQVRFDLKFA